MTFPNGQMPSDDSSSTSDRTSPRIGKADLHIHTSLGDGLASVEQIFDFVQNYTDLDVIAITDHDDSRGALQALDLIERKNYRFSGHSGKRDNNPQRPPARPLRNAGVPHAPPARLDYAGCL